MSTDTELVVVAAKPAKAFSTAMFSKIKGIAENSPLRKISAGGAPRLTVKGNKFYIKMGSTEQLIKTGKKPAKELDVVIHDFSPDIQRQLAEPYDTKNPQFVPKGCWSNDGNQPDENVWNKQSEDCDTCPVKMECNMSRNLVVSLYSAEGEVEHPMIFTTNWSSNSTKKAGEDMEEMHFGLINYLKFLVGNDVESYKVITRLVIDDWSENTPANNCKVLFKPIDALQETDPNWVAHDKWLAEDADRLSKLVKIEQRQPSDDTVGGSAGADTDEEDLEADVAAAEKAAADEAAAKKAAAAKKRKDAAAKKKADEAKAAAEKEEEVDLDDLDEDEEETEDEGDDIDMSDLDDLLADLD